MYALIPAQFTTSDSDSSRPESTRSFGLLGRRGRGPLLGLINAARLFPQGAVNCQGIVIWLNYVTVTELQLHRLRMELIGEMHSTETYRRDAERD